MLARGEVSKYLHWSSADFFDRDQVLKVQQSSVVLFRETINTRRVWLGRIQVYGLGAATDYIISII